jgi:hypothetical protein
VWKAEVEEKEVNDKPLICIDCSISSTVPVGSGTVEENVSVNNVICK